jgi:LPLT family lysophospholipid transporter-like MFS transporter
VNRGLAALLGAQFLSAFSDNAILFTAIAMVMKAPAMPTWYVPALQSSFLVSFVVLAPWVGGYSDRRPKRNVLVVGNAWKAAGTLLMIFHVEPILAYALVGAGAAVYGPAKYGILPELVPSSRLVRANGWVEGSTIVAIILGPLLGGWVADRSVMAGLALVLTCYGISIAVSLLIPAIEPPPHTGRIGLAGFVRMARELFRDRRARFGTLGTSLFWGAGAVLRLLLVAWAPLVLGMTSATEIAGLTLFMALGIVAGSLAAPGLIPMERLRRARLAAYAMGCAILALAATGSILEARVALAFVGFFGGLFMVPINAVLQDVGHNSVGSGGAVAVQNFFENVAMLSTVGVYTAAAAMGAGPARSIACVGLGVLVATVIVTMRLPRE